MRSDVWSSWGMVASSSFVFLTDAWNRNREGKNFLSLIQAYSYTNGNDCLTWSSFSARTGVISVLGQCEIERWHRNRPEILIYGNPLLTALAEFPPRAGTRVRNLHVAYITILLLVFQTTAHAGPLKTEMQPLPWQGQCYLWKSLWYFTYVTSWGLWVLDLDFSCLIPHWVCIAESSGKVTAYTVPCVYLPVPQSTR